MRPRAVPDGGPGEENGGQRRHRSDSTFYFKQRQSHAPQRGACHCQERIRQLVVFTPGSCPPQPGQPFRATSISRRRGTPTPLGVFVWPSQPERRVSPRQVCGTAEPRSRGACVRPPLDYVCSQPARAPATNMRDSPPRLRASNGTTYAQPPRGAPSHHSHSLQRGAAPELERAREGSQISSSTQ